MTPLNDGRDHAQNGAALAAFLAAGIGAFAVGLFVILKEAGVFVAPALYAPSGGITGRMTFAVVIWLVAWLILHARWKTRELAAVRVHAATFGLLAMGLLFCFPPVWHFVK